MLKHWGQRPYCATGQALGASESGSVNLGGEIVTGPDGKKRRQIAPMTKDSCLVYQFIMHIKI